MRLVVLGEDIGPPVFPTQPLVHDACKLELFVDPLRRRLEERGDPDRRESQVGLEQPLEFQQRLFIKNHMVELGCRQPRRVQAVLDRVPRKPGIVLAPREPLLLGRGDNAAVNHERGGGIVIKGGNAQDRGHRCQCVCARTSAMTWLMPSVVAASSSSPTMRFASARWSSDSSVFPRLNNFRASRSSTAGVTGPLRSAASRNRMVRASSPRASERIAARRLFARFPGWRAAPAPLPPSAPARRPLSLTPTTSAPPAPP